MPNLTHAARDPRSPAEASLGVALHGVLETALDQPIDLVTPTDPLAALLREAVVAAGWRPPPRVITDVSQLDALPYGSVVLPKHCSPFKRKTLPEGLRWVADGFPDGLTSDQLFANYDYLGCPIAVLHIPTETERTGE